MSLDRKQWMFTTVVLSRLVFNLHVVVPSRRFLIILNDVYLRCHRRMRDVCRTGDDCETDLAFRERTGTPSIDCLLCRARLRYLGRMTRAQPPALVALLRQRVAGRRPAWIELVVRDMARMLELVARCASLPPRKHGGLGATCCGRPEDVGAGRRGTPLHRQHLRPRGGCCVGSARATVRMRRLRGRLRYHEAVILAQAHRAR